MGSWMMLEMGEIEVGMLRDRPPLRSSRRLVRLHAAPRTMSHHEHDPMKGHHRTEASPRRRRFRLRLRPRYDEHLGAALPYNPWVRELVRDHRDAPISPRARLLWWLAGLAITAAGVIVIIFSR